MLKEILSSSVGPQDATPISAGALKLLMQELFGGATGAFPTSLTTTASTPMTMTGAINKSFATLSSPAGATPALKSFLMPGGALAATAPGSGIRVRVGGTFANNVNAKTVLLKFGATTLLTVTATASVANTWYIDAVVFPRTGATQVFEAHGGQGDGTPTTNIKVSTAAETLSGDISVAVTGTQTSAADITQEYMFVEYAI